MQDTPRVQDTAIQSPWTTQAPLRTPLGERPAKRKRSRSLSPATDHRPAPNSVVREQKTEENVTDTFSGDEELWAEPATTDVRPQESERVAKQEDEDEDGPSEAPVARRLDFSSMRRAATPTRNGRSLPTATQNVLEDDGVSMIYGGHAFIDFYNLGKPIPRDALDSWQTSRVRDEWYYSNSKQPLQYSLYFTNYILVVPSYPWRSLF